MPQIGVQRNRGAGDTGSPLAGIWLWPAIDGNHNQEWIAKLKKAISFATEKYKNHKPDNARNAHVVMPDFIYVPRAFLAFKVNSCSEYSALKPSQYWFANSPRDLNFGDFAYVVYKPHEENGAAPSRLQVLTFWLAQEILKFAHEVPDLFAYAFSKDWSSPFFPVKAPMALIAPA
jgi:hypothetical protein